MLRFRCCFECSVSAHFINQILGPKHSDTEMLNPACKPLARDSDLLTPPIKSPRFYHHYFWSHCRSTFDAWQRGRTKQAFIKMAVLLKGMLILYRMIFESVASVMSMDPIYMECMVKFIGTQSLVRCTLSSTLTGQGFSREKCLIHHMEASPLKSHHVLVYRSL